MADEEVSMQGLVLAGGTSSRYGNRNKLLDTYEGRPIIGHVVATLRTLTEEPCIIAVRTEQQREAIAEALGDRAAVQFSFDHRAYSGPTAGIAGSLSELSTEWVFVCGGDMPLLSQQAIERLASRRSESADVVVPVLNGYREPLHALYRRTAVGPALQRLPADAGPRALFTELTCTDVDVESECEELVRSLKNVNKPEELDRIL